MRNYTTQMDAASKGIRNSGNRNRSKKEHMPVEKADELVAEGKVAICANKTIPALIRKVSEACSVQRSM